MHSIRSRDCIVLFKGDSQTVAVSQAMVDGGWPGGQGVQWDTPSSDIRIVTYSKGLLGGFLVWGSNEDGDDFTAISRSQPHYRFATLFFGGSLIQTSSYERYTYASRLAPPLVPIVYEASQTLYFSLRGLWTSEDELTLSGDPLAPAPAAGVVAQVPKTVTNYFLGVHTTL